MKIPPKSLYTPNDPESSVPTQSEKIKENSKEVDNSDQEQEENETLSLYDVENTFEELDFEDRKWLLFQLVLSNPIFLEEVMLGFPMSLVVDDDVARDQLADGNDAVVSQSKSQSKGSNEEKGLNDEGSESRCPTVSGDIIEEEDDSFLDMSEYFLVMDEIDQGLTEEERTSRRDQRRAEQKEDNKEKEARLVKQNPKKENLLPILVPDSEWLLTYCQIDAIPSSTRDEFLLNLFLMSPTHSSILQSFYSSLESGRMIHEEYETYPDEIEWKDRFNEVNEGRRVVAKAEMGVDYGSVMYWEEMGEGREGVWDVALFEIGGWLMRDLPFPHETEGNKSPEVDDSIGKQTDMEAYQEGSGIGKEYVQERGSKGDEPEYHHTPELRIAGDHIKMMGFIIQTKTLSLVRQITRPDSASDYWPGRYRDKALSISDMVKLSVLLARSPLPLRKLLHDEIRSISAEIIILFDELEGAECEWVRVDDDLAWDLECVLRGLDDVGYRYLWEGVMTSWYEKSV